MSADQNPIQLLPPLEAHGLWAPIYDQMANPLLALEEREMEQLLPEISGKFVLDLACGTGRWLGKLLEKGACHGAGLDFSAEMLGEARRKNGIDHRLVRGTCASLPFRGHIAEFAICSFAADYISDLREFARGISRVMRPGGDLFITDFHPSGAARGWRRSFRCGANVIGIESCWRSLDAVCRAFEQAEFGLQVCLEARFGEPEKAIFARSGKAHLFIQMRDEPVIYIARFRRL